MIFCAYLKGGCGFSRGRVGELEEPIGLKHMKRDRIVERG